MRVFIYICFTMILTSPVFAASIAVVDMQALVVKSKAAQSIGKQLEDYRKSVLKDLSAEEKDLVSEEKSLVKAGRAEDADKAALAKDLQAFNTKRFALQKKSVEKKAVMRKASKEAERKLMDYIVDIVADIAAEDKYDLVLTKDNVIVGSQSLEITDEALSRLNKAVTSIDVKL